MFPKIPLYEWEFNVDQKTERKLVISNVDHDLTCILQKRRKRGEASLFCEMNKKQKNTENWRGHSMSKPI